MHPPFSFVLPKENAPCTVEEKSAFGVQLCPSGVKLDGRELVVRGATNSRESSAGCAIPGTNFELRRRIWGLGRGFGSGR